MRAPGYKVKFISFAASSFVLSACFAVTDLERFSTIGRGSTNYDDLDFGMKAAKSHVTERFEFRVIDSDNVVQCRGVIEPLDAPDFELTVRNAVPKVKAPYRLDFYAEHDLNGAYSGIPLDHSWRVEPLADTPATLGSADDGVFSVAYEHNTSFTDLEVWPRNNPTRSPPKDTGAPAIARVRNLPAEALGNLFEMRVVDHGTGHTVGYFRVPALTHREFELNVGGVVDAGVDYDVKFYLDANGNRTYENPAGTGTNLDRGWSVSTSSDASGFIVNFDPTSVASNVDVGTAYPAQALK
jgi:hypothetical protein